MSRFQQFMEAFHMQRASHAELLLLLLFLALLVLALMFRDRWEHRISKRRRIAAARRTFIALARERGLNAEEMRLFAHHFKEEGQEHDPSVLQYNGDFDRFADYLLKSAPPADIPRLNAGLSRIRNKLGFRPPPVGLPLSSTRELSPPQTVYLVFPGDYFLEGRVEEVDEIGLWVCLRAGLPAGPRLQAGVPIQIYFNRAGDARYSDSSRVVKVLSDDEGVHLELEHGSHLRRDQRRRDFRVEDHRTIGLWVMDGYLEQAEDPLRLLANRLPERVQLVDISGGGASVIFEQELPINQRLFLNLDPARTYGLPIVQGTTIRVQPRGKSRRWGMSVRFEDLRPSERQKLVRYVFMQERDLLRSV